MKQSALTLFVLCAVVSHSQNLVPNPGFETTEVVYCGIAIPSDFDAAMASWYSPSNGTPDVYSTLIEESCWNYMPESTYGGPICNSGSQLPHSGDIFAGIRAYTIDGLNQREYIQVHLSENLVPGNLYCLEFYASLADNTEFSVNSLGAHFSTTDLVIFSDGVISAIPQVTTDGFLTDDENWVLVSGSFIADAPYAYLTIGNFNDDENTSLQSHDPDDDIGMPGCYGAQYYIDDVSLTTCETGIAHVNSHGPAIYYSIESKVLFVNTGTNEISTLQIIDCQGRIVMEQLIERPGQLSLEQLESGVYFYSLANHNMLFSGKFVKQ